LPEVTLGIIPAQAEPSACRGSSALSVRWDFILSAKPVSASQAKDLGFLDDVIEGICAPAPSATRERC
jgi:enoyl-CoA hydratase/carnithine racemase